MGWGRKTAQLTVKQNSHISKCRSIPGQHSCHVGERQGLQEDINVKMLPLVEISFDIISLINPIYSFFSLLELSSYSCL